MHDSAVIEDRTHPKNRAAGAVALATGCLVPEIVATNDYAVPSPEEVLANAAAAELDNEAAALRATAKALRADAAEERSVGRLTFTVDTSEIEKAMLSTVYAYDLYGRCCRF